MWFTLDFLLFVSLFLEEKKETILGPVCICVASILKDLTVWIRNIFFLISTIKWNNFGHFVGTNQLN